MRCNPRRAGSVLVLVTAALGAPRALRAQEQPAVPDSLRPVPLAPLTVTILRMPLPTARTPYAVAAVDARREGRAQAGLALDEALRAVPGVQVDNRYNYALGERISIRGFGARAQFGVRGVKVLLDGIPATLPDGQTTLNHVDMGSLGRVEVVRGPAASVYGNAAGGVVQLETVRPPAVPILQELRIVNGANGLLRLQSRTGGQAGRVSYQANVARLSYDGYRASSDARNTQADAQLRVEGERDRLQVTANFVDYDAKNPGSLSDSLLRVDRFQAYANNVRQRTGEAGRQAQLGVLWRHRMEPGELELSTYGIVRSLENPIPVSFIDLDRRGGGVRALYRGRLSVAGRDVLWTVGSDVDAQHDDRVNHTNEQGTRGTLTLDQVETVASVAGFVQVSAPITDRVSVLGGLRYDNVRFKAKDRLIDATNPDDSGRRSMDRLSPSFGVVWNAAEAFRLYGNYATSFQTPTTTELANRPTGAGGFNPTLEPEHTRSLEVGARGRLGPGLDYQLALFRARVENELIGFEVPTAPGRTYFRNAGSAVHRGVEAELSFAPIPELIGRVAYTYTDARFGTYRVGTTAYDGNLLPGVAPHRAEGVLSIQPGAWYVDLDARYVSRVQVNDANTAASPAYALFDARAGLAAVRVGGLSVAPFVGISNLFDREYNTSVVINAAGARYYEPGPGRAFHAGATLAVGHQ